MAKPKLKLRDLSAEELTEINRRANSRTLPARMVERARIIRDAHEGLSVSQIAERRQRSRPMVMEWITRFNRQGVAGLNDAPRSGRPMTYTADAVATVISTALTDPQTLQLPFASWTLDRLEQYLNEQRGIAIKRSRIDTVLLAEGLRWRSHESWFGERVDPDFAAKGGNRKTLSGSAWRQYRLCLDQMGPASAKSFPGQQLVQVQPQPSLPVPRAERAKQEIDYGRRGKGYIFGAFQPRSGEALTHPYARRTTVNWIDFLERVEQWVPATCERIYAMLDNLSMHRAADVLLFALAHPRWEFVFQPKYAAYLNLIEPWWKILRSLALKGRRFETWQQIEQAIAAATAYWNQHRHPFIWGRRRRHQPRRSPGIALVPSVN